MPQDFNCQMNLANRAEMREQNGSQLPNGKSNSFHNHIQLNCQLSQLIFPLLLLDGKIRQIVGIAETPIEGF